MARAFRLRVQSSASVCPTRGNAWRSGSAIASASRSHRAHGSARAYGSASRGRARPPRRHRMSSPELRGGIADDEALARRRLRTLLAQESDVTVVAEAANGPEAIDVVREHSPDVLFLDVRMPGATGIDVLETLGPESVGAVVLVTAFDEYAVAAFEHHALDYVLKPVDEDRFRATVARVRERLRQQRSARLTEDTLRALAQVLPRADGSRGEPYLTRIVVRSDRKT